jgi:hypothetical protein
MENYLICGLAFLVVLYGSKILDRLPKPKAQKDFTFELPDQHVAFRVETLLEDDFEISFVDGWNVGRSFSIYGTVLPDDDRNAEGDLDFGNRAGVKIGASPDWFQRSRIGFVHLFPKGGCEMRVALPWQIARQVLEDLRRDADQVVSIGVKKDVGKDGKVTYGIYSFELGIPWERI